MPRGRYGKPTSEDGVPQIDSAAPVKEEGSEVKLAPTTEDFAVEPTFVEPAGRYAAQRAMRDQRKEPVEKKELISCLQNKRVIVRFVPKETGLVTDPKHVLYGGMAMNASRWYSVPKLRSGEYKNVLTNDEKEFLEDYMGLEPNALSIYRQENNYWRGRQVKLEKQDNYLDLSNPEDYIKYKILLANSEYVAPSITELERRPLATYEFVVVDEQEAESRSGVKMETTKRCYMEFGKHEMDWMFLKTVVEILEKRTYSNKVTLNTLKDKCNALIQDNPGKFLRTITDELLPMIILVKRGVMAGIISTKGAFYYLRSDGSPLCDHNEDPTLRNAAHYLSLARNQALRFTIEGQLEKKG